jgi:L-aminopeptidase/D-esterase-like protein
MRNLITDVAGVRVGYAEDRKIASGVTAILFDTPAVAAADLRGGAPGTALQVRAKAPCSTQR